MTDWVALLHDDGTSATFSAAGELLGGDWRAIDREYAVIVEEATGGFHTLRYADFLERIEPDAPAK
jgi:hypothetical protein